MNKNAQSRPDQETTVTSKSSGLKYVSSKITPSQGEADKREKSTKNDKV